MIRPWILFVLTLAGCAHSAPTLPHPAVDAGAVARSIVLCKTTEAELRGRLGEPTRDPHGDPNPATDGTFVEAPSVSLGEPHTPARDGGCRVKGSVCGV